MPTIVTALVHFLQTQRQVEIIVCDYRQNATDAVDIAYVINCPENFCNDSHKGSNKYKLWWIPAVRALQIRDVLYYQIDTKIRSLICAIVMIYVYINTWFEIFLVMPCSKMLGFLIEVKPALSALLETIVHK